MFFLNRNELCKEYQELLMKSSKDEEIISKIESLKKYIKNRHGSKTFDELFNNQKGSFLALVLLQYNYDRNFYIGKLKVANDTEKEKLMDLIAAYDLLIEEIQTLIVEEQEMISHQIKQKKLEKILTPKEIEVAKREYFSSLNTTNLSR